MEKEAGAHKSKDGKHRDSSEPGTIVAGPDAHARESAGKTPQGRGGLAASRDADSPPPA